MPSLRDFGNYNTDFAPVVKTRFRWLKPPAIFMPSLRDWVHPDYLIVFPNPSSDNRAQIHPFVTNGALIVSLWCISAIKSMRKICCILPLVLLASLLSLSSCVNEVKNPAKTQTQDTLSQLKIIYSIPDSNNILTVNFHAFMTPPWQKNFCIDWNFGDSTGVISKFDTSNLTHYYQKYGSYLVTLSVFDTVSKTVLGKTSILLNLEDNAIDTNYLHGFRGIQLSFFCARQYSNDTTKI